MQEYLKMFKEADVKPKAKTVQWSVIKDIISKNKNNLWDIVLGFNTPKTGLSGKYTNSHIKTISPQGVKLKLTGMDNYLTIYQMGCAFTLDKSTIRITFKKSKDTFITLTKKKGTKEEKE